MNRCSILVIDDDLDHILIIKRAILKLRTDCAIETITDGTQALERLQNENLPALIFLDQKMPGLAGDEVLRKIRGRKETRYIPVVMLTSSQMETEMKTAYDAGANSFLHKTHDLTEFTNRLKAALHYWLDVNLSPQ